MVRKINNSVVPLNLKNSEHNFKYIEKNREESALFLYKGLEINDYVERTLKLYGFILVECKLSHSYSDLKVFISFYDMLHDNKSSKVFTNLTYMNRKNVIITLVNDVLLASFSLYHPKKTKISFKLQNLNKKFETSLVKVKENEYKNLLKKFRFNLEFKEILKASFIVVTEKNSAKLLAKLISYHIHKIHKQRKHNFLISFFNKVFESIISLEFSSIVGLKVLISGRLNGAPRAKSKAFRVGSVSLQSDKHYVDYCEDTAYTVYGTFGVKVWVFEKV